MSSALKIVPNTVPPGQQRPTADRTPNDEIVSHRGPGIKLSRRSFERAESLGDPVRLVELIDPRLPQGQLVLDLTTELAIE
jgi:hypothetical protein